MGLDRFDKRRTRDSDDPITFTFFGGSPASPNTSYTTRYLSRFHSGEVDLRYRMNSHVILISGLRFLESNEEFDISSNSGVFASATDNDL